MEKYCEKEQQYFKKGENRLIGKENLYVQRKHDIVRMPGSKDDNDKKLKLINESLRGTTTHLKETFNDIDSRIFEY